MSDHFTDVWKLYNELEGSSEPSSSSTYQNKLKQAIDGAQHLLEIVDQLDLYSSNEELDEVASKDLKFVIVPALLGKMNMKRTSHDVSQRPQILEAATKPYMRFLQTCSNYGVGPLGEIKQVLTHAQGNDDDDEVEKPKLDASGRPDLKQMVDTREAKIRKYKEGKERKEQISKLQAEQDLANVDEDLVRRLWLLHISQWIDDSLDDVRSIREECKILKFMRNRPDEAAAARNKENPKPNKGGFKPFMLTKDKMQKAVYGAGYPSLPTMTLDEFYEREMAAGRMPDSGNGLPVGNDVAEDDDVDKSDDDAEVAKKREMDEYKDTHRRGDGNRYRKG